MGSRRITPWPTFEIHLQIALRLTLGAGIFELCRPALGRDIISNLTVPGRSMLAIKDVIEDDLSFCISGHCEAQRVGAALPRHTRTAAGVAEIAQIA
jgi:hypothetical protein